MVVYMADAVADPVLIWTYLKTERVVIPGLTYTDHLTGSDWRELDAAREEFERTQPDLKPVIDAARQRLAHNSY